MEDNNKGNGLRMIKDHVNDIVIWGVIVIFSILYVSLIFNHNIWTDEAFTLQLIKGNYIDIVKGTMIDVHPPLYYFIAKIGEIFFGQNLQIQKIITIIPMVLTLCLGPLKIRKRFGDIACYVYILFLACVPCSMEFAVQVRMYSLAILCVTACGIYAIECYETNCIKSYVFLIISAVAAAYTHYYALVAVGIVVGLLTLYTLLLKRKQLLGCILSIVAMIILYMPWMITFIRQTLSVTKSYWIPQITGETIWNYFVWTFDSSILPGIVYGYLFILVVAFIISVTISITKKEKESHYAILCVMVPFLTCVFGVIVSLLTTPIYRDQYIFPSMGLLAMFFAISIRSIKKWCVILISLFLAVSGTLQYAECYYQEYKSTLVNETEAFFNENLSSNDYIVYNWEVYGLIYECYFDKDKLFYVEDFDFSQDYNIVWFIDTIYNPEVDPAILEQYNLEMFCVGQFGIEHNPFELYMITTKVE